MVPRTLLGAAAETLATGIPVGPLNSLGPTGTSIPVPLTVFSGVTITLGLSPFSSPKFPFIFSATTVRPSPCDYLL